jgi:radical SAM protein with 4Fe4S-binding SPASM domain
MPGTDSEFDTRDAHVVAKTVETWLGNPVTRGMLKFACSTGKNGIRLDYGLKRYSGLIDNGGDFWDNMAYRFVKFTIDKGSTAFGVEPETMREGLKDPVFRRALVNVLGGIAEHGVQKPQVSIAPFLVVWNFTHCCNLRCKHCYENSDGTFLPDELTTEEAKRAIDQFAEVGVVGIAFSGGEPLIRKDFFEVAKYARNKGFYVSIATNGTMVTPEIARKIRKIGVEYVEVSLDGFEKEHDALRRVPGAWKKACRGIRNCLDAGIDTCVATTVTKRNHRNMEKFMDFVENKLKCKRIIVFNYIPTGRGKGIIEDDLTPEQREKVNKLIYGKLVDDGCKLTALSTAPLYARIATESAGPAIATHFVNQSIMETMKGKTQTLAEFIGGCGAGRLYCGLEPNGDVEPCVFMQIKLGNIRNQSLKEIWKNHPTLKRMRDRDKIKGCGKCEHRYICGGCRARAYGYYGDVAGPDPGCMLNKSYWNALKNGKKGKRSYKKQNTKPKTATKRAKR